MTRNDAAMQLASPAPDNATHETRRKIFDRAHARAVPDIASTTGIRRHRCCLRDAYATRYARNRSTPLTNDRVLLRNASNASSEVHVITFHPSIANARIPRDCCSASARTRVSTYDGVGLAPLLLDDEYAASRLLGSAAEGSSCPYRHPAPGSRTSVERARLDLIRRWRARWTAPTTPKPLPNPRQR